MIRQGPNFLVDKNGNKESASASSGASRRTGPDSKNVETFENVESWIFDLDNTLYPHHLNLWQQVDVRIHDYIVDFLKVTHQEAVRVQKDYYRRYGTTMRGLMEEHGLDPEKFLEVVHEIDHSPLTPNPALGAAIAGLPGRKLILTNGTRRHADAVMRRLEIEKHFEDVFDIAAAELEPKPRPQVYERFLARHRVDPGKAAIFEDLARNLEVPHALGMTTVLVVPERTREVFREEWELAGRDAPHRRSCQFSAQRRRGSEIAEGRGRSEIPGKAADVPGDGNEQCRGQAGVAPMDQLGRIAA
jgi:putative hydrolase of the HAD superfamily